MIFIDFDVNRKFIYKDDVSISLDQDVSYKLMNNILEVKCVSNNYNPLLDFKKISKNNYVNISTGELFQYKQSVNRRDNVSSLKRTFKKIRDLINNNFIGGQNELHIVLTYAENMTDTKRLYRDFEVFIKRFKRRYKDLDFDYLTIVEPQGRGAWHHHLLLRVNNKSCVFIPSNVLSELWGNGFVKVRSLYNLTDNIGAYLSAYLSDIEVSNSCNLSNSVVKEVDGKKKKFLKGGRLRLYPVGMNIFRKSRGIVYPEVFQGKYKEIKKIIGDCSPTYKKSIGVYVDDKIVNCITYEHYNLKRI